MKLTKLEFKEIIKESIVELLKEGRISPVQLVESHAVGGTSSGINNHGYAAGGSETVDPENRMGITPNARLNEAVKNTAVMVAKGDVKQSKMYESIFMDTARTTLQDKLAAEMGQGGGGGRGRPATAEEKEFDKAVLTAFEGNSRWATLAFRGKKPSGGSQEVQ